MIIIGCIQTFWNRHPSLILELLYLTSNKLSQPLSLITHVTTVEVVFRKGSQIMEVMRTCTFFTSVSHSLHISNLSFTSQSHIRPRESIGPSLSPKSQRGPSQLHSYLTTEMHDYYQF